MRALEHITVLDLTHMLSGPYGAMILSDLGARTIKVEPPGEGEGTRKLLATSPDYARDGMGAYFLTLNRGKESVCVDLKSESGLQVFYDLVRKADVVVDNFSAGVPKRLRIDHDTLSKINPRIVTCSITGFGETGVDPNRPAFDQVVQGMGGGMSITGFADRAPVRSGIPHGDLGGGMFGAMGIMAALLARDATGVGRHVDVSMLDVQVSLLNYMATMYLMSGHVPDRIGNSHFVHVPYNTFKTATDYIIIACIGDAFFEKFLSVVTRPELRDPAYLQQPARYAAREKIEAIIEEELVQQPADYWLAKLREQRIPCAPVNNLAQALGDAQVRSRNMVVKSALASGGSVEMPGNPIKLSDCADPSDMSAAPSLGQDTDAVLSQLLGYGHDDIARLRASAAIQ